MTETVTTQDNNNQYLSDLKYFWKEKGDLERYSDFDLERLKKLDPKIFKAWITYKETKELLTNLFEQYEM